MHSWDNHKLIMMYYILMDFICPNSAKYFGGYVMREIGLCFLCLWCLWFWYQDRASFIKRVRKYSQLNCNSYPLTLNTLISEAIDACSFLCEKDFKYKFSFSNRYRTIHIIFLKSSGGLCLSKNLSYLNCCIYWHKIIYNIPLWFFLVYWGINCIEENLHFLGILFYEF